MSDIVSGTGIPRPGPAIKKLWYLKGDKCMAPNELVGV